MAGEQCEKLFKYRFEVYGRIDSRDFHRARICIEITLDKNPYKLCEPVIQGMSESDWATFSKQKKREVGGDIWSNRSDVYVFMDTKYLGGVRDLIKLIQHRYGYEEPGMDIFNAIAIEEHNNSLIDTLNAYCYLDITIDHIYAGRLIFELFYRVAPRTCENFRALCLGFKGYIKPDIRLTYQNTTFHRLKKDVWIQGGDVKRGKLDNFVTSSYGRSFPDETFQVRHAKRGCLSVANRGPHTNGDQFVISLNPNPWMDRKYVAFGQLVEGSHTLKLMEQVRTDLEVPLREIKIVDCGEIYTFPCICHELAEEIPVEEELVAVSSASGSSEEGTDSAAESPEDDPDGSDNDNEYDDIVSGTVSSERSGHSQSSR